MPAVILSHATGYFATYQHTSGYFCHMPVVILLHVSGYLPRVSGYLPHVSGHLPRVNDQSFFFLQLPIDYFSSLLS